MPIVNVSTLTHPVIVSPTGRAPVLVQSGTGLNGGGVPSANQFAAIKSVPTTRQPPTR